MVRLALPGLVMVEAECLAFEVLTLAASYFGTTHLAAQSVLATLTCITFQYVFSNQDPPLRPSHISRHIYWDCFMVHKLDIPPPPTSIQTTLTPTQNPLPNQHSRLDPHSKSNRSDSPRRCQNHSASGRLRRHLRRPIQCHTPLIAPKLHPPTLHQRRRRDRARRQDPPPVRRVPALRRPRRLLQWRPARARQAGGRRVRAVVLLLCGRDAD